MTTSNNNSLPAARQVDAMVASLKAAGQLQPILIAKDETVLDGHVRLEACKALDISPWTQVLDPVPLHFRAHTFVRRTPGALELADILAAVRAEETPPGARRAPGTGKAQHAVAKRMAEDFGMRISARQVSLAMGLTALPAEERAALERANPDSMRSAHRALNDHRLGTAATGVAKAPVDRTELIKAAHEFKAAVLRNGEKLSDGERALLQDLRAVITDALGDG